MKTVQQIKKIVKKLYKEEIRELWKIEKTPRDERLSAKELEQDAKNFAEEETEQILENIKASLV